MKHVKKEYSPFSEYLDSLPEKDRALLDGFFANLRRHLALNEKDEKQICGDFEKAFLYYAGAGVGLEAAMERLRISKLGGFYTRPPVRWYPLDDAAKIYPLSMKRYQMAVFRLSVYTKDPVVPELLQLALAFSIKRFPSFATTVKKGFFWHYLDASKRRFAVMPERDIPCRPLNIAASGSFSFRVLYYKTRISVEFFHVLTDGAGGLVFLKTLAAEYLRLLGADIPCTDGIRDVDGVPSDGEIANDFSRAEPTEKSTGFMDGPAVQMTGRLSSVKPCQILHFELDSFALQAAAKHRGASVTAYVLAMMFVAQKYATDEPKGKLQVQVPVNLRKFFGSDTVRNFSLYCNIKLPIPDIAGVGDIIPGIARQLGEKTSKAAMMEMMNGTVRLVRLLRYVPLILKRPAARLSYGFLGERVFSSTLSNLGVVSAPAEMAARIEKFEFVLGTVMKLRAACAMVTFGGRSVLSVSKNTADPSFEERLYGLMREDGLEPVLKGSPLYGR